ncbi:MAG: DoxX family protein [bacterium]
MKQENFNSLGLLIMRLGLGIIIFAHGAQKMLGWFGGYGWSGTMQFMTGTLGYPAFLAAIAIIVEFFGPLFIITGAATRLAAILLMIHQLFAAQLHLANGFFMNYFSKLAPGQEGFEYNLVLIALSFGLFFTGPGAYALDAKFNLDFIGHFLGVTKARPAMAK